MQCLNCGEPETRTDPLSYLSGFVTAFVVMMLIETIARSIN